MNLLDRIIIDPEICHGKPTLRGLRYPVEMILELLSSGMTTEEILADYEDLEREDILAALEFALRLSQVKRVAPLVAMKFLIDAQLPRRLAHLLREAGFEAVHTLDLPLGNRTPDRIINELSIRDEYVVVSKDNENHVIQYSVTTTDDPKSAVFLSDEAPGTPRFRLTYRMKPDGAVAIVFDIAPPGAQEFKTYLEGAARKK